MNNHKLFALLPLAYIVWWFYTLATWFIPILSTAFGSIDWTTLSIWAIAAPIIFMVGGGVLLIATIVIFVAIVAV